MYKIIKKIVLEKGDDFLATQSFVGYMDDCGAFKDPDDKPYKKLIRCLVSDGYIERLLAVGAWNEESRAIASEFARKNMLEQDGVNYVFSCIAYGLGWCKAPLCNPLSEEAKLKEEAEREAREKAEREAREKAEREAREKAERERIERQRAEREAREEERRVAQARAEREREREERARHRAIRRAERKEKFNRFIKRASLLLTLLLLVAGGYFAYKYWDKVEDFWYKVVSFFDGKSQNEGTIDAPGEIFTVNGVSFKMVAVEGGTFEMGSETGFENERPVHSETVSDFMIGETEVTQALWEAVMENNPSEYKGAEKPVHNVSWYDCQTFIKRLNKLTGKDFRLPTEAEWEYAARGGHKSKGIYTYSGSHEIKDVAWYDGHRPHDVKTKMPNELGVYDMSGNVEEWCGDSFDEDSWEHGGKALRGGSYRSSEYYCTVSHRSSENLDMEYDSHGFRIVLSLETNTEEENMVEEVATDTVILGENAEAIVLEYNEEGGKNDIKSNVVQTTGTLNGHDWVDLGLPSGTKWATCNLGANSPEEYGDYYAWGETSPWKYASKGAYADRYYKYYGGSDGVFTKYCNDASHGKNGFTDNLTTLEASDDAATVNWGSGWRMPTKDELDELKNNCTATSTNQNGVNGLLFTSRSNGNSIFLPCAGGGSAFCSRLLSSSLCPNPNFADALGIDNTLLLMTAVNRYTGLPVRPVCR